MSDRRGRCAFAAAVLALVGACDQPSGQAGKRTIETLAGSGATRQEDPQQLALGAKVYQTHCAACHGDNAQGAPDWRRKDADGFYPPPPLNGSGHEWHHSTAKLREIIKHGSLPGQGRMPAWEGTLSDAEIDAVIAWFQSLWPDQVYAAWYDMQQRSFGR